MRIHTPALCVGGGGLRQRHAGHSPSLRLECFVDENIADFREARGDLLVWYPGFSLHLQVDPENETKNKIMEQRTK